MGVDRANGSLSVWCPTCLENVVLTNKGLCLACRTPVRRLQREERLRKLGFKDLTERERRDNLALNIALLPWMKRK